MDYKLIQQDEMTFTGFSKEFDNDEGKNYQDIAMYWGELFESEKHGLMVPDQDELGVVGVSYDWSNEEETFQYMVGIRNDVDIPGTVTVTFEPKTYARFEVVGACPQSIQDVVDYIHTDFLRDGKYRHAGGPEIEEYLEGDAREDTYVCYYWVPVVER